jgi:hypothetical protein
MIEKVAGRACLQTISDGFHAEIVGELAPAAPVNGANPALNARPAC